MYFSQRLEPLKSNVFADMDAAKARAIACGKEIIDLSLGSSDLPTPEPILDTIAAAVRDRSTHGYPLFHSTLPFREAVARWYENKYGLPVDPEREVLLLIGSQEGTAHLPLALLDPGDYALVLDPGYPSHAGGVYLAGGRVYRLPLLAENRFLPQLETVPEDVCQRSRMLVLNYPHNPTTAIAPLSFFEEAVAFCRTHDLALVHDFTYGDFAFAGVEQPPSVFAADPNKECSIEFYSLSKSYNMGGFRIGYAIGNMQLIAALRQVKAVIDFNQYRGIMRGAIAALDTPQERVRQTAAIFQQRRDTFVKTLHRLGWSVEVPEATMYIWARLPQPWQHNSIDFCVQLVEATGIAAAPGAGFGEAGEGYVRFALVRDREVLERAAEGIARFIQERSPLSV